MDAGFKLKKENPKETSNIISKLFFMWMIKLCYKGTKYSLQISDLYKTLYEDKSEFLGDKLEDNWRNECIRAKEKQTSPSLLRALIKTFIWRYMLYGLILLIQAIALRSFQPMILSYFIKSFNPSGDDMITMYISGSLLIGISVLLIFMMHHVNFGQSCIGMRIRIAVSSLVYRKMMKLNRKSLGETAAGQVVNLLSNDVNRFDLVTIALHFLWITPFQVLLISFFLWDTIGVSCLAGILSMVLFTLPVQGYLGKLTSKFRLQVAVRTDRRVKLMSEVISGIQVIKMYAWEIPFQKMIKLARAKEISALTKTSYLRGIYLSCMVFIERTTLFLSVTCYVLLGNHITADMVFSMAQYFNILQLAMAIYYPAAISYGAEALVSVKRLQDFLILDEREESNVENCAQGKIVLENVNASWTKQSNTLKEINMDIKEGTLCVIVGPVGAGKSSILQLLLKELIPNSGRFQLGGVIAYASQESWLFASTVRKNILFGQPFNRFRYSNTIRVCALERDFEQLPMGDKTIVGERGVALSGGQRARINLARAIYREADIYLLDDPLSAVDTHVSKHLFQECIVKHLKNKTRILVTHQIQFLKQADHIIVVNEGRITSQGTFDEILASNLDFTKLSLIDEDEIEEEVEYKEPKDHFESITRKSSILSTTSVLTDTLEASTNEDNLENHEEAFIPGLSPFKEYVMASGNKCVLFILISVLIAAQAFCTLSDLWVAYWTTNEELRHKNTTIPSFVPVTELIEVYTYDNKTNEIMNSYFYTKTVDNAVNASKKVDDFLYEEVFVENEFQRVLRTNEAIYIYTVLIVSAIVVTLFRSLLYFKVAMNSSKNLHKKIFHALLDAPMRFFDTNPSGRVLNRFSKDIGSVDEILPRVLIEAIQIMLVMCGILVNIIVSNWLNVIAIIILGSIFLFIRHCYICTARDVKRLEGITKSPVFSHINSSLNGITTIRAANAEQLLIDEFDDHQNVHTSAWFLTISCTVCFGLWMDIVCVVFITCITFMFVIMHHSDPISSSMVGLAISQALILIGMLQHGMRQTAEVINQLTSVERILHYTKLDNEGPFQTPTNQLPPSEWPNKGRVEFKSVFLKYVPTDPPVLKDLNIVIESGEKIGIVGRTGAGKSSLISALFRLTPLEGAINIDGRNTSTVGLTDLRKKISIIPQEPILFSASLRYNLDPFNEYKDASIWNALSQVELKDVIDTLDYPVSEGGNNFSLGQKQLICLARAILRNNKILVLDEATANVDPQTDALIQTTIRKNFAKCTVLTIAHRLNTIMDSDKVLVMEGGRMLEFDHPHSLLQREDSHFLKMVEETGPAITIQLKDIAYESYKTKFNNY